MINNDFSIKHQIESACPLNVSCTAGKCFSGQNEVNVLINDTTIDFEKAK